MHYKTHQRLGGLKPQERDDRDFQLGVVFDLPPLSELPESFEHEPYDILDQGGNDFCSAATRAGMKAIMEDALPFYPAIFALSKEISQDLNEWGQTLRNSFKATIKSVPLAKDAPKQLREALQRQDWVYLRDIKNYPTEYIESGRKYADSSFFSVVSPQYDAYDTARAALWKWRDKKQTIAIGVVFSWSLETEKLEGVQDSGYGHMMFLSGFTKEGIIIVNSYGRDAGNEGKHIISRETVNHFAKRYGMMMGVDMPKETAKYYVQNNIKECDNWIVKLFKSLTSLGSTFGAKRSSEWNTVRKEYLKKSPSCAVCGVTKKIEIHHLSPVHIDSSKELDETNLISLCRDHHYDFGHLRSWYSFNRTVREDAENFKSKIKNRP